MVLYPHLSAKVGFIKLFSLMKLAVASWLLKDTSNVKKTRKV
jgi:hypothetical protein